MTCRETEIHRHSHDLFFQFRQATIKTLRFFIRIELLSDMVGLSVRACSDINSSNSPLFSGWWAVHGKRVLIFYNVKITLLFLQISTIVTICNDWFERFETIFKIVWWKDPQELTFSCSQIFMCHRRLFVLQLLTWHLMYRYNGQVWIVWITYYTISLADNLKRSTNKP